MTTRRFWTWDDIREAKRLVKHIVQLADCNPDGVLAEHDVEVVLAEARRIMTKVLSNKGVDDLVLPL